MKIKLLICLLTLISITSWGESPTDKKNPLQIAAGFTLRLVTVDGTPFYGTGYPFKAIGDEVYFVTNAHILGDDPAFWKLIFGYLDQVFPIEVVGMEKESDIAVIKINFAPRVKINPAEINRTLNSYFNRNKLKDGNYPIMFVGSGNHNRFAHLQTMTGDWQSMIKGNLEAMKDIDNLLQIQTKQTEANIKTRATVPLKNTSQCPVIGISDCYIVSMASWGFSGSPAMVLNETPTEAPTIIGLVSHFAPLTERTYLIPIDFALKAAERILKKQIAKRDSSGQFEFITNQKVRYVGYGQYFGQEFAQASSKHFAESGGGKHESSGGGGKHESSGGGGKHESSGGGGKHESSGGGGKHESSGGGGKHESSGGGGKHESSGGGGKHESSGGGGKHESSGGGGSQNDFAANRKDFYLFQDFEQRISGYLSFDHLRWEMEHPESWRNSNSLVRRIFNLSQSARKSDSIIDYLPGVMHNGEHFTTTQEGKSITHLQDFMQKLKSDPELKLIKTVEPKIKNQFFGSVKNFHGFTSSTSLVRLNTEKAKAWDILGEHMTPNNLPLIDEILINRKKQLARYPQIAALQQGIVNGDLAVPEDSYSFWWNPEGGSKYESIDPDGVLFKVEFPGKWQSYGAHYFKYVGPIVSRESTGKKIASATASFQYLEELKRYELKILSAYWMSPGLSKDVKEEPFDFSDDYIFQAAYLPLKPVDVKPELTLDPNKKQIIQKLEENSKKPAPVVSTAPTEFEIYSVHIAFAQITQYIDRELNYPRDAEEISIQKGLDETFDMLSKLETQLGIEPLPLIKSTYKSQTSQLGHRRDILEVYAKKMQALKQQKPTKELYLEAVAEVSKTRSQSKGVQPVKP